MLDFKQQLQNSDPKTLDELVRESFRENRPVVDVSFFYRDKKEVTKTTIQDINNIQIKLVNP